MFHTRRCLTTPACWTICIFSTRAWTEIGALFDASVTTGITKNFCSTTIDKTVFIAETSSRTGGSWFATTSPCTMTWMVLKALHIFGTPSFTAICICRTGSRTQLCFGSNALLGASITVNSLAASRHKTMVAAAAICRTHIGAT